MPTDVCISFSSTVPFVNSTLPMHIVVALLTQLGISRCIKNEVDDVTRVDSALVVEDVFVEVALGIGIRRGFVDGDAIVASRNSVGPNLVRVHNETTTGGNSAQQELVLLRTRRDVGHIQANEPYRKHCALVRVRDSEPASVADDAVNRVLLG